LYCAGLLHCIKSLSVDTIIRFRTIRRSGLISSEHLSALVTLFNGGTSFGEDINYDPEFELVKAEILKLGGLDYDLIEMKSLALLSGKSKDIRLFLFLGMCYMRKNEWESFCDCFDALCQLIEKDYNAIFPQRPRAKQLAFGWLGEDRFLDLIDKSVPSPDAHESFKRLVDSLGKLKVKLDIEFPNGSPFPARLYQSAQKWVKATEPKKEAPPPPPPAQQQQTTTSQTAGTVASQTTPVASPSGSGAAGAGSSAPTGPMENVKDALELVRKAAIFLIEKEPLKPAGYRLMRSVRWDSIENAPAVTEGNLTRLDPLPEERRNFLQGLLGKGDFKVAFETVEKTFSSGVTLYWLDLQRIAATAAKQLGPTYDAVRNAIQLETALFVKRVPKILTLAYSDGTPFCDPATLDWINSDVVAMLSSGKGGGGSVNDSVEADKRAANDLASGNKVDDAVDLLMSKINESGSERDNFRRRVVIASIMISSKRPDIAIYILENLVEIIDRNNLVTWEPSLAAEALNYLVRAYNALLTAGKDKDKEKDSATNFDRIIEKRDAAMKRLSFADPKIALSLIHI
jgi:type VI secretion system protein VasJ